MPGPRRHHDCISVAHQVLLRFVKNESRLALLDAEELVDIRVHLVTDVFARAQAHDDQLGVRAGE
jgi:hypothetical protein